jgi:hypothetical protein
VAVAAKLNTGDRQEGDVLDYRANGRVVELHRGDVVLARGLWWRGKVRSELSTRNRRRRRTVAIGDEAPVSERGRELAGQLRKDAVELKTGLVQVEQLRRDGTTVSSSSPAFGWKWWRCSEASEWKKEGKNATISSAG